MTGITEKEKLFMPRRTRKSVLGAICLVWMALTAGCGDFFAIKPTELESKVVLDELSQVRESQHINNPMPEIYTQPPSRVQVAGGMKLFYFSKNLPVKQLSDLAAQQLGLKIADNPSTNQLVVYCADDAQADVALNYLEMVDVPPVQVNVDCLILERFGDVTMDWETTLLVENLFGENITLGETKNLSPAFPGASLREPKRSEFGLDIGYWLNRDQPGHRVRTVVDLLVSRGYLKVLLNPQIETINGQKATVTIRDLAPTQKIQTGSGSMDVFNITEYKWVENTLTVTPFVYADGAVGLTTNIKIGSRSKPEGVVQNSIITERSIDVQENRIERGKSLIIGGMRKSEKRDVIRGVPVLKDLPIIGVLFSSRDFEEKGTEIIFILTPSISGGSRDHKAVISEIRTRYADPDIKRDLGDMLMDPLGSRTYTNILEKEAVQAEMDRVDAELQRQQAQHKAAVETQLADDAWVEAERLRQEAKRAEAAAQKELAEAQKSADHAEQAKSAEQAETTKAAELEAQKQKAAQDAQQAKTAAQEAQLRAQQAQDKAAQQEQRAREAMTEAGQAQQAAKEAAAKAAEKARLAAEEKARREAEEKARKEAEEKARLEAEEKVRLEAAEKARIEAEEKARLEAEEKARIEAQEKANQEAQKQPDQQVQPEPEKQNPPAEQPTGPTEQSPPANQPVEQPAKQSPPAAQPDSQQTTPK